MNPGNPLDPHNPYFPLVVTMLDENGNGRRRGGGGGGPSGCGCFIVLVLLVVFLGILISAALSGR